MTFRKSLRVYEVTAYRVSLDSHNHPREAGHFLIYKGGKQGLKRLNETGQFCTTNKQRANLEPKSFDCQSLLLPLNHEFLVLFTFWVHRPPYSFFSRTHPFSNLFSSPSRPADLRCPWAGENFYRKIHKWVKGKSVLSRQIPKGNNILIQNKTTLGSP